MKEDDDENVSIQLELYESRSKAPQHEQQTDVNNSQTLELPDELLGNTEDESHLISPLPSTIEVDK